MNWRNTSSLHSDGTERAQCAGYHYLQKGGEDRGRSSRLPERGKVDLGTG